MSLSFVVLVGLSMQLITYEQCLALIIYAA
jgi:hypothetical protein